MMLRVAAFALFSATALSAQQVRGTVVDSASGSPLAGAVVMLLDSAGRATTRTIAAIDGRYSLTRPATAVQSSPI